MNEKQIIRRIYDLCEARSWTVYRLAKESGIPYSTLCTMLHKSNAPSFSTLMRICKGFGITLGQFFDEGSTLPITPGQTKLLESWKQLSPEDQVLAEKFITFLLSQ